MNPRLFTTPKSSQELTLTLLASETLTGKMAAELNRYEKDFLKRNANSAFTDKTRQKHLNEMKTAIEQLDETDFRSVANFLIKLNNEIQYAKSKKGKYYEEALNSMLGMIIEKFNVATIERLENNIANKVNPLFLKEISEKLASQGKATDVIEDYLIKGYILPLDEKTGYYKQVLEVQNNKRRSFDL